MCLTMHANHIVHAWSDEHIEFQAKCIAEAKVIVTNVYHNWMKKNVFMSTILEYEYMRDSFK
jgi:hypothetical protein